MAMNKIDDGGPAFPRPCSEDTTQGSQSDGDSTVPEQTGMTMRDYFAAKAMQACFAGDGARMVADRDGRYDETNWSAVVAANAYEMADAMLAARKAVRG